MKITLSSPAKINRTLFIKEFSPEHQKHALESVMQKISLSDVITIEETPENFEISLKVSGKFLKGVPENISNIMCKAIDLFYTKYTISPEKKTGFKIFLEKNIPNEAGLGGGSSNAAEILKFLHTKHTIPLIPAEYVELGSDIPFFLEPFSCGMLTGVGEKITEISGAESLTSTLSGKTHGVLIFPENISISTAWAFSRYKEYIQKSEKLEQKKHREKKYKNSFTPVLCQKIPEISQLLKSLEQYSQGNSLCEYGISGSGSTLFALFSGQADQKIFLENFSHFSRVPVELQLFTSV